MRHGTALAYRARLRLAALTGPVRLTRVNPSGEPTPVFEIVPERFEDEISPDDVARDARIATEIVMTTLQEVRNLAHDVRDVSGVAVALLERVTDCTHLTVAEAAMFLNVTEKTVRNRIQRGVFTLECIPGTRRGGIPVDQLASGWIKASQLRRLREKKVSR